MNKTDKILDQTANGGVAWYVAKTHQGAERRAKFHLERQGFRTYLPMRICPSKRDTAAIGVFIPGYIFVAVDLAAPGWSSINSTIGVTKLVCVGDRPRAVPTRLIERIQAREVFGLVKLEEKPVSPFKSGQKVKTLDGMIEGLFQEAVDARRGLILVSLLGRDSVVPVELSKLVA